MRALLDVNVLIALLDAAHTQHDNAHGWLRRNIGKGWASCPITQNGAVRIMSQPGYPQAVSPTQAAELLRAATSTRHHEFWPDDVSLLDGVRVDMGRIHGPRQITDAYLLLLAVNRNGRFATFDTAVPAGAIRGVSGKHLVVL
jgi:toxin-antitoxin system PIN domain toxin